MIEKMIQVKFPIVVRNIDGSAESHTLKSFCETFLDKACGFYKPFDHRFGRGFRRSVYDVDLQCFKKGAVEWNDFVAYDRNGEAIDPEELFSVARSALYWEAIASYGRRTDDPANPSRMPGSKRSGPWFRSPRLHGVIRLAAAWLPEEDEVRPRQSVRTIRESRRRGRDRTLQRSWKVHRKTQWKARQA